MINKYLAAVLLSVTATTSLLHSFNNDSFQVTAGKKKERTNIRSMVRNEELLAHLEKVHAQITTLLSESEGKDQLRKLNKKMYNHAVRIMDKLFTYELIQQYCEKVSSRMYSLITEKKDLEEACNIIGENNFWEKEHSKLYVSLTDDYFNQLIEHQHSLQESFDIDNYDINIVDCLFDITRGTNIFKNVLAKIDQDIKKLKLHCKPEKR